MICQLKKSIEKSATFPLNTTFMKFFMTLLLATGSLRGTAQNTIKPGDKIIRYDLIKPSHDFYKNVTTDTAGNILYEFMMEDVTTIDTVNKRITFARSRQVPVGSFSSDTSVTDLSLRPIRMHEVRYQRNVAFEMFFGDTQVIVKMVRKEETSVKNYPMKSGYFEDNMIEYIFGYLELKKGVTYVLDNFNKDAELPSDPYTIEYAFDDVWDLAAGQKLSCSVIHFIHGASSGYIWVDKSTHKAIKKSGSFKGGIFVITRV
jgi:hypothetical protein